MAVRKTVRIYDLARELKQDTKRVLEELRRAGADVSVASNSVPVEFADKLRNKYLTKPEAPAKPRAIKVIKAKKDETPVAEEIAPEIEPEIELTEPEAVEPVVAVEAPRPEQTAGREVTKVLKPKPKPVAEPQPVVAEEPEPEEIPTAAVEPE